MFWIGVDDPTGRLMQLQANLSQALDGMGFRREDRDYRPHLTLGPGEVRPRRPSLTPGCRSAGRRDFGLQRAGEAVVYGSVLLADGPTYTPSPERSWRRWGVTRSCRAR